MVDVEQCEARSIVKCFKRQQHLETWLSIPNISLSNDSLLCIGRERKIFLFDMQEERNQYSESDVIGQEHTSLFKTCQRQILWEYFAKCQKHFTAAGAGVETEETDETEETEEITGGRVADEAGGEGRDWGGVWEREAVLGDFPEGFLRGFCSISPALPLVDIPRPRLDCFCRTRWKRRGWERGENDWMYYENKLGVV